MSFLALVYAHAKVLMMVCHPFPSGVSGRFIDTTSDNKGDTTDGDDSDSCTFLFWVLLGNGILVITGDLDRLRKL